MNRELFEAALQPLQQRGQRRAAPHRHRQPGPASPRSGSCLGQSGGHPARRLPVLSRPERAGRGQARRGSRSRSFLDKVPEPSAADVQAFYDKYKDVLPDPARDTPGFKVPRQVQVEILSIDGNALARGIQDKLTEAELRTYYENHKAEFEVPSELPDDLFADAARPDPAVIQPFAEVRASWPPRLAEEKAQAEIVDKFNKIKDEVMIPFADKYLDALDEQDEAKKQGGGRDRQVRRHPRISRRWPRRGAESTRSPRSSPASRPSSTARSPPPRSA